MTRSPPDALRLPRRERSAREPEATPPLTRRQWLRTVPALAVAPRLLGRRQPEPLRVRGIHQVTLGVSDVARSLAFYQRLLGLAVQARRRSEVLLRLGDGPAFLALASAGDGPPRVLHFGLAVAAFDVERTVRTLAEHGVARVAGRDAGEPAVMEVRVADREGTSEVFLRDPSGLLVQLMDERSCGGRGPLGTECPAPEAPPEPGALTVVGLSHLTNNVPDPQAANDFYRRVFGMDVQAYQATSPLLGVGPGDHFLMHIPAGPAGAGARVNHSCLTVADFAVERVHDALERHGIRPRDEAGAGPLRHWVSMRMPDRGGAPEGTPELYFSDPDGLAIQLQDAAYCGGGGFLGDRCA